MITPPSLPLTSRGTVRRATPGVVLSPEGEALVRRLRAEGVDWRAVNLRLALVERRLVHAGALQAWAETQGIPVNLDRLRLPRSPSQVEFTPAEDQFIIDAYLNLCGWTWVAAQLHKSLNKTRDHGRGLVRSHRLPSRAALLRALHAQVDPVLRAAIPPPRPAYPAGHPVTWGLLWAGEAPAFP